MPVEVITREELELAIAPLRREIGTLRKKLERYAPAVKGHAAAAEIIGVCEHTMVELCKRGKIPYKKEGRRVVYALTDLEAYNESQRILKA